MEASWHHLSKRLEKQGIAVDFLVTIDAAKGTKSNSVDRKIGKNVKKNLNIFQKEKSAIGSRGDKNTREDGSETGIQNEISVSFTDGTGKTSKVVHSNIDEATYEKVINEILNKLKSDDKNK